MKKVAAELQQWRRGSKSGWISVVKDRAAPTNGERILVYDVGLGLIFSAYWCDDRLRWVSTEDDTQGLANIAYWQPFPSDPKDEGTNYPIEGSQGSPQARRDKG